MKPALRFVLIVFGPAVLLGIAVIAFMEWDAASFERACTAAGGAVYQHGAATLCLRDGLVVVP